MNGVHEHAAEILRGLRGDRTQQAVAEAVGTTQQAIARYENGTRIPSDEMKGKLAEFYKVTVTDIFYR